MFDLSFSEILVIVVACIIFINPKDMPEILKQVGKAFRKLKKTVNEFTSILEMEDEKKPVKKPRKKKVLGLDGKYHDAYDVKEVFKENE